MLEVPLQREGVLCREQEPPQPLSVESTCLPVGKREASWKPRCPLYNPRTLPPACTHSPGLRGTGGNARGARPDREGLSRVAGTGPAGRQPSFPRGAPRG